MNEPIAIEGVISGYRSTADGCLKVTIELNELQTVRFHEGFTPAKGILVAVARMQEEKPS